MKIKKIILLHILFLGLLVGCTNTDEDTTPIAIIKFTQIRKANLYGDGREHIHKQNLVVSDSISWNLLLQKINIANDETQFFRETDIDFSEFMVLAVFDDIKANGGHSIDIMRVTEYETKIVVDTYNLLKGDLTTVITQPFHIVKIPKQNKPIVFN